MNVVPRRDQTCNLIEEGRSREMSKYNRFAVVINNGMSRIRTAYPDRVTRLRFLRDDIGDLALAF